MQRLLNHATAAMTLDRGGHLLDDEVSGVSDALATAINGSAASTQYFEAEPSKKIGQSTA